MNLVEHNGSLYKYNDSQLFVAAPTRYVPKCFDVAGSLYGKIISYPVYKRDGLPLGVRLGYHKGNPSLFVSLRDYDDSKPVRKVTRCFTIADWRRSFITAFGILEKARNLPKYIVDDYYDNLDSFLELIDVNNLPIEGDRYYFANGFPKAIRLRVLKRDQGLGVNIQNQINIKNKNNNFTRSFSYYENKDFFNDYEEFLRRCKEEKFIGEDIFKVSMNGAFEVKNYNDNILSDVQKALKYDQQRMKAANVF